MREFEVKRLIVRLDFSQPGRLLASADFRDVASDLPSERSNASNMGGG